MEFSEYHELQGMLKFEQSFSLLDPNTSSDQRFEGQVRFSTEMNYSPPLVFTQQCQNFHESPIQTSDIQKEQQNFQENDSTLELKRDESYLENYHNNQPQESYLTKSLQLNCDQGPQSGDGFQIQIYLFETENSIQLNVQQSTTVEQLIKKIIQYYRKSNLNDEKPLKSIESDDYNIWLVEDDSYLPDTDFAVDREIQIKNLSVDSLAFCEKPGLTPKHQQQVQQDQLLGKLKDMKHGVVKVCIDNNWAYIKVYPGQTLKDILPQLQKRYPHVGYLQPKDYEFHTAVQIDEDIRMDECILDMDLPVETLGAKELRLQRKNFADAPAEVFRLEYGFQNTQDGRVGKNTTINLTKAQAAAYKEFNVIKYNRRGRKQKRVLGIDQLRLYNMTQEQAKQSIRKVKGNHIIRNKLTGLFKSITHHPELPMNTIKSARLDENNENKVIVEHVEDGSHKKKVYETEDPADAMEIVVKINLLLGVENQIITNMAFLQPLLDAQLKSQGIYTIIVVNPFDEHNEGLKRNIKVFQARNIFNRTFKKILQLIKEEGEVQKFLVSLQWLLDQDDEDEIPYQDFLVDLISMLLMQFTHLIGVQYQLFFSRDQDEIFIVLYSTEVWLKNQAEMQEVMLQLRNAETDDVIKHEFKAVPPFIQSKFYQGVQGNISKHLKHYDQNDDETVENIKKSIFRQKDKIMILYDSLIDYVDLGFLIRNDIVVGQFCNHNQAKLEYLQRNWGSFTSLLKWQPLQEIRNYFGESIALYFAWVGYYRKFETIPSVIGLVIYTLLYFYPDQKLFDIKLDIILSVFFALIMSLWITILDQHWSIQQQEFMWQWGLLQKRANPEKQRQQFKGKIDWDEVTGTYIKFRKNIKKFYLRKTLVYFTIFLSIALSLSSVTGILIYREYVQDSIEGLVFCAIANGIYIKISNIIFEVIATKINNIENWETESEYEINLIVKLIIFKFINSYSSLFYIAFVRKLFERCVNDDCIMELSIQIMSLFIISFVLYLIELSIPQLLCRFITNKLKIYFENRKIVNLQKQGYNFQRTTMGYIEKQAKLIRYSVPLGDLTEMIIQYGYVVLFCVAFPILPLLDLIVTTFVIKFFAARLCFITQRIFPRSNQQSDIWKIIVQTIGFIGILANAGIIVFTTQLFDDYDLLTKLQVFLVLEHVFILLRLLIPPLFYSENLKVIDGLNWGKRIVDKILYNRADHKDMLSNIKFHTTKKEDFNFESLQLGPGE